MEPKKWAVKAGQLARANEELVGLNQAADQKNAHQPFLDLESFQGFVNHVRATAEDILFLRGQTSVPTNAVIDPEQGGRGEPGDDETYEDAVYALNQRFKGKGGGKGGGRKGPEPERRAPREDKCGNCGGAHLTVNCTKPRIAISDRLCHSCGKPGHISSKCPNRGGKGAVKAVDEPGQEPDPFFGCVTSQTTSRRTPPSKPKPSVRTLASVAKFVPTAVQNRFASLATGSAAKPDTHVAAATRRPYIVGAVKATDEYGAATTRLKAGPRNVSLTAVEEGVRGAMGVPSDEAHPAETPQAKSTRTLAQAQPPRADGRRASGQRLVRSVGELKAIMKQRKCVDDGTEAVTAVRSPINAVMDCQDGEPLNSEDDISEDALLQNFNSTVQDPLYRVDDEHGNHNHTHESKHGIVKG